MSLIAELKRRKIAQWTLGYAAGAWALLQAIGFMVETYDWPHTVSRIAILVVAIGFLATLVLAWYHGERGEQHFSRNELLLLAILLVLGGSLAWRTAHAPASLASNAVGGHQTNATATNPHSIAVLPFVNMSGDKDNEYFSDGISEEILNVLARIPELQVAARTSSFAFKDGRKEVPEIARELKVRMVLEGSVRKQGMRVRITAQLIDSSNGFHVWSQTYDRDLKDIFAIQDEIAKAIADELKVKLGAAIAPKASSTGTRNIKAYDLYLRGLALWQLRRENSLWQAIDLFERAVASDPEFAQAYAGQALVYAVVADYSVRISYLEAVTRAQDYAERANALDPTLPEPYAVLGQVAARQLRRETAEALFRRAIALRPSFATAHQWRGTALMAAGKLEPALVSAERSSTLDPLSRVIASNHSQVLLALGRYAEANAECERALRFAPDAFTCLDNKAFGELLLGHFDAARPLLKRFAEITNPSAATQVGELVDALQGHGDRHALALRLAAFTVQSAYQPGSGNVFESYERPALLILLGEPKLALALLERLVGEDGSYADWAVMMPALDPIRCDPRFVAVVKQLKTFDPHYAKVCGGRP